jgi:hypothetical protein
VLVKFEKVSVVAHKHRISPNYASAIATQFRKNKAAFDELYQKKLDS